MSMPGFTAEAAVYKSTRGYRGTEAASSSTAQVVPAIPPCHACDDILTLCARGEATGAVCYYCAIRNCDPEEWRNPPDPFPRPGPWRPW